MNPAAGARALLVAGIASGQGKTTFTCALARRLVQQGQRVRAFKIGPDFIDPGFLAQASGAPVHNLDLWMVGEAGCRQLLADVATQADWLLVEGAMGLYDGAPSGADLAARLGIPVLAVIDAGAMAETFGALALGLRVHGELSHGEHPLHWAGVAANRVASPGHGQMLRQGLHTAGPRAPAWIGQLSRSASTLPERHLGLVQAREWQAGNLERLWHDLDAALDLDTAALDALPPWQAPTPSPLPRPAARLAGMKIAVARDAAFSFCYDANLDLLRTLGAELAFFSPLADETLPRDATAAYLPGGYPELHADTLAQARRFMDSLREHHARGLPIVAECGGMMACAEELLTLDGRCHRMAGLLPATAVMGERLAGLGLHGWETAEGELRGHVFHYGRLHPRGTLEPAARTRPRRYGQPEAIYRAGALTASFFHGYFASCPEAAAALFLGAAHRT